MQVQMNKAITQVYGKGLVSAILKETLKELFEDVENGKANFSAFKENASNATYRGFYGSAESYWVAHYLYAREIGVEYTDEQNEILDYWAALAKSCGWWWPLDEACILSDRPTTHFNDQYRLHNLAGPAVSYSDGFELFLIEGVRFPKALYKKVTGNKMPGKDIMKIENIEQRMIALKLRGADKLLEEFDAELIHKSDRGNELYKVEKIFSRVQYFLKYSCPSTGRVYVSGIDPEYAAKNLNADACMSWKLGFTPAEYDSMPRENES